MTGMETSPRLIFQSLMSAGKVIGKEPLESWTANPTQISHIEYWMFFDIFWTDPTPNPSHRHLLDVLPHFWGRKSIPLGVIGCFSVFFGWILLCHIEVLRYFLYESYPKSLTSRFILPQMRHIEVLRYFLDGSYPKSVTSSFFGIF